MIDYSHQGIFFGEMPPEPLPEGFNWGPAKELETTSNLIEYPYRCCGCPELLRAGEYVRALYGPRGANFYHDDCTEARDFTPRGQIAESRETVIIGNNSEEVIFE